MRRWNGWGEDDENYVLGPRALSYLRERLGPGRPRRDASRSYVLRAVPESRIDSAVFSSDPAARLDHSLAQSFPDWIEMRSGRIGPVADGIAFPNSHDDVVRALAEAKRIGAIVVPYGGGTSVVGHLRVPSGERPVVNISLEKMNRLRSVDDTTMTAVFEAGTPGPGVERQLASHGYLVGHFPQSYEYSTIGGWVVTRSSGQQSYRYGRIESIFHSGLLATPRGDLVVGHVPASSAGPDLREALMGSEGRFGILTDVTARVRRLPEHESFHGVFFPAWQAGIDAVRELVQNDQYFSMLRLSNPLETKTQLKLAHIPGAAVAALDAVLGARGAGAEKCLLMAGITGTRKECALLKASLRAVARAHGGVYVGRRLGAAWAKNRYRGPYVRNTLWDLGYGVDTLETCVMWPEATPTMHDIERAVRDAFAAANERVHAFTHLSHVYRQGCSIYSTFIFPLAADPDEDLARWHKLKASASEAIVAHGGTISHQHGVGIDHAPYLRAEKGDLGIDLIRAMAGEFDPDGMMNPGKLFA